MDPINIGGIIVAMVAAAGAWASQRAAARASLRNITTNARLEMEDEAYERARDFDMQTIKMQERELKFLRRERDALFNENRSLKTQNYILEQRLNTREA